MKTLKIKKKIARVVFGVAAILMIYPASSAAGEDSFLMVHFEVTGNGLIVTDPMPTTSNLMYQAALWQTAVDMVALADSYDFKLTLCFTPQWGEYILQSQDRVDIVNGWKTRGHEIAFHHHDYDHTDWDGYSNRTEDAVVNDEDGRYRGTVSDGFAYIEALHPQNVITGTVTGWATGELPDDISILTRGGGIYGDPVEDCISIPEIIQFDGREIVRVDHGFLGSVYANPETIMTRLEQIKGKYIEYTGMQGGHEFGVVTHCHDYHRHPYALKQWFEFIVAQGHQIKTVRNTIDECLTGLKSPFGINSPVTESPYNPDCYIPDIHDLGGRWIRLGGTNGLAWDLIEKQEGVYDWDKTDALFGDAYMNNIRMNIIALSMHRDFNPKSANGRMCPPTPQAMNKYLTFLKAAVERYDGDGIDDAPGSPVVDVWEIDNELSCTWGDTLENYAELLKRSYGAIKLASPNARVAFAGLAAPNAVDTHFIPVLNNLDDFADPPYFDICSLHWSGQYEVSNYKMIRKGNPPIDYLLPDVIAGMKAEITTRGYGDIPIWISEMSDYDGEPDGRTLHSEAEHATELLKRYVYSLANGVEKILWVTLTEWNDFNNSGQPGGYFDSSGLIHNPLNDGKDWKKLAYYTYKKTVELLEGSDWNAIEVMSEGADDVYIYKFVKDTEPVWVAWWDYFDDPAYQESDTKTIVLDVEGIDFIETTRAVPIGETGTEVIDYSDAFEVGIKAAQDESIQLTLAKSPVFATACLPPAAVADFKADSTTGDAPFTVQFTDLSTQYSDDDTEWFWDFGDYETSIDQNPSYRYDNPGTYTVSLSITGARGADTEIKADYITVNPPPAKITSPEPGSTLTVEDLNLDGTVTFEWSPVFAETLYYLTLQQPKGTFSYCNWVKDGTEDISGIELNGEQVHVELWSKINGQWHIESYSYETEVVPAPAELIIPDPQGSGLIPAGPTTFKWTEGVCTEGLPLFAGKKYILSIGTTTALFGSNIYNPGWVGTDNTQVEVDLPAGKHIYVRLVSRAQGKVYYHLYEFDVE